MVSLKQSDNKHVESGPAAKWSEERYVLAM